MSPPARNPASRQGAEAESKYYRTVRLNFPRLPLRAGVFVITSVAGAKRVSSAIFDQKSDKLLAPCKSQVTMASRTLSNTLSKTITRSRPVIRVSSSWLARSASSRAQTPVLTSSQSRHRPTLNPNHQPIARLPLGFPSTRTIFIQTENTPNPDVSIGESRLVAGRHFPKPKKLLI